MRPWKHDRHRFAGALSLQISLLGCNIFLGLSLRPVVACFSEDADVTLANGSARALKHMLPGDKVLSWNAETEKLSVSVVRALLRSQLSVQELVTIELRNALITASEDTPFWSYTRQGIVSLCPEATRRAYSLNVSLMSTFEELQSAAFGPQKIVRVHRGLLEQNHQQSMSSQLGRRALQSFGCNAPALDAQTAVTGVKASAELSSRELTQTYSDSLACMTLHLEDLHWFFVNGVQVHNKGGEDDDPILIIGLVFIMFTIIFCLGVACCVAAGRAEQRHYDQQTMMTKRMNKYEGKTKSDGIVASIGRTLSGRLSKVTPDAQEAVSSIEQRDLAKKCYDSHDTEVTTHEDSIKSRWNCSICNRISHDKIERFTNCKNCAFQICSLCLPLSSNAILSQPTIKSPSQRERMNRASECAEFHEIETRTLEDSIKSRWNCGICNRISTDRQAPFVRCRSCALDICSTCLPRSSSSMLSGHGLSQGSSWRLADSDAGASGFPNLE